MKAEHFGALWTCDACGETAQVVYPTIVEAEDGARPPGWRLVGGLDLCPSHLTVKRALVVDGRVIRETEALPAVST